MRRLEPGEGGLGWNFVGVVHFNTECVGYHVCKEGTRHEVLNAMGLTQIFGSVEADLPMASRSAWTTGRSTSRTTS